MLIMMLGVAVVIRRFHLGRDTYLLRALAPIPTILRGIVGKTPLAIYPLGLDQWPVGGSGHLSA